MSQNNIGEKIKSLRLNRKMSQAELAELLKYDSVTAISLIEQGKRNLSIDNLKSISTIFNIPVSDLMGLNEPEKNKQQVGAALRSSGELTEYDIKEIEDYIKYIKFKNDQKKGR